MKTGGNCPVFEAGFTRSRNDRSVRQFSGQDTRLLTIGQQVHHCRLIYVRHDGTEFASQFRDA